MTVKELSELKEFKLIAGVDGINKNIVGMYAGDLLSHSMSRAKEHNAFITVLTNYNVIAVSLLLDLSCVIICNDNKIDDNTIEKANENNIPLLISSLSTVETIIKLHHLGI